MSSQPAAPPSTGKVVVPAAPNGAPQTAASGRSKKVAEVQQPGKGKEDIARQTELSFWLVANSRAPQLFTLNSSKKSVTIGRGAQCDVQISSSVVSSSHCELFLRAKNREAVLCVKDASTNGTGVRDARASSANHDWHELHSGDSETLQHRSQLLVPAKLPAGRDTAHQLEITVHFVLPDMYCEWNQKGRWLYREKLGEGGLAVVYKALDKTGGLGEVAVKVSKFSNIPPASAQNRHIYALHREAQWSLQRLHNPVDDRYKPESAALFARYLEDHTGFSNFKQDFDDLRARFEDSDFAWAQREFTTEEISRHPYVVMELIKGRLLQRAFEGRPPLEIPEKRSIVIHCAEALVYMETFGVIHRDFRGCNIFCVGSGGDCSIKVIDLGFMVSTQDSQVKNPNPAVRCAWQGDPAKKLRFDWAPPEVRKRGSVNFALPASSFDVFSFGILVLKLLKGRAWTQEAMYDADRDLSRAEAETLGVQALGLNVDLLLCMLDQKQPTRRPSPEDLLRAASCANASCQVASQASLPAATTAALADEDEEEIHPAMDSPVVEAALGSVEASDVPKVLRMLTPNGQAECNGIYHLLLDERPNGYPAWEKRDDPKRWIYSSTTAKWHIGTSHERRKNFQCSSGWIFHDLPHNGTLPHLVAQERPWQIVDSQTAKFRADPSISISAVWGALPKSPPQMPPQVFPKSPPQMPKSPVLAPPQVYPQQVSQPSEAPLHKVPARLPATPVPTPAPSQPIDPLSQPAQRLLPGTSAGTAMLPPPPPPRPPARLPSPSDRSRSPRRTTNGRASALSHETSDHADSRAWDKEQGAGESGVQNYDDRSANSHGWSRGNNWWQEKRLDGKDWDRDGKDRSWDGEGKDKSSSGKDWDRDGKDRSWDREGKDTSSSGKDRSWDRDGKDKSSSGKDRSWDRDGKDWGHDSKWEQDWGRASGNEGRQWDRADDNAAKRSREIEQRDRCSRGDANFAKSNRETEPRDGSSRGDPNHAKYFRDDHQRDANNRGEERRRDANIKAADGSGNQQRQRSSSYRRNSRRSRSRSRGQGRPSQRAGDRQYENGATAKAKARREETVTDSTRKRADSRAADKRPKRDDTAHHNFRDQSPPHSSGDRNGSLRGKQNGDERRRYDDWQGWEGRDSYKGERDRHDDRGHRSTHDSYSYRGPRSSEFDRHQARGDHPRSRRNDRS